MHEAEGDADDVEVLFHECEKQHDKELIIISF